MTISPGGLRLDLVLKVAYRKLAERIISCGVAGERIQLCYTQATTAVFAQQHYEQLARIKPDEIHDFTAIALTRMHLLPTSTEDLPELVVQAFVRCKTPIQSVAFMKKFGPLQDAQPQFEELLERTESGAIRANLSVTAFLNEAALLRTAIVGWREFHEHAAVGHGFADVISGRLDKKAAPLLKPNGGSFTPVLFCDDLLTGLYAWLFVKFTVGKPYMKCARVGCENIFELKGNKECCSIQCQQANASKRYRTTGNYREAHSRRRKKKRDAK